MRERRDFFLEGLFAVPLAPPLNLFLHSFFDLIILSFVNTLASIFERKTLTLHVCS